LLALPFLAANAVTHSGDAYGLSKRANHLRVQAESLRWGDRGARVTAISPGIILTPLAQHELDSPVGPVYRSMIEASAAKRVGTPEEVAAAAASANSTCRRRGCDEQESVVDYGCRPAELLTEQSTNFREEPASDAALPAIS
jgi:NAD(P)-dependent dehydrogenase (short-subunit alcohol dehydrogenase family)